MVLLSIRKLTDISDINFTNSELVDGQGIIWNNTNQNWNHHEFVLSDYAEISANASGTEQTGIGTSFVKVTQFDTNVAAKESTADAANDKITLGATGEFICQCYLSFEGSNNAFYTFAIFVNGVEVANLDAQRKLGTGADVGTISWVGFFAGTSGQDVDVRVKTGGTVDVLTIHHGTLSIEELD